MRILFSGMMDYTIKARAMDTEIKAANMLA